MEIIIAVAAKAAEYTVDPIKRGLSCIFNPQSIIQETHNESNQLQVLHKKVVDRCRQAGSNGEEIIDDVNQWLHVTEAAVIEVDQWVNSVTEDTDASSTTCSTICSSKWVRAHKQRKNAIQKKEKIGKMLERGQNFSCISHLAPVRGIQLLSGDGFIVYKSVRLAFNDIMQALKREEQNMIGVYGMGGVGKTSLVKKAITAAEEAHLFNRVVVSVVSQAPNIHKIQAELGEQLSLNYSWETEVGRAAQLESRIKFEENILVVLDDVWQKIDLASIGIPFGDNCKGCKVLLTTRLKNVCAIMDCQEQIVLNLLDDEESWDLFKRNAGTMLIDDPSPELETVAQEITRECDGLPLALVVVASALRDKSQDVWELALQKLQSAKLEEIEEIDPNQNVYERIKLSYDFLKSNLTKRCFLMCSLFPEDHEISVEVLTRYAFGYGLFDEDTIVDSYAEATRQLKIKVSNLLECNLLLKPDNMSDCVKMHDMVRDAALWITSRSEEEVFLVPIPSQKNWIRDPKLPNAMAISLLACPLNQHLPSAADYSRLKLLLLAQRITLENVKDNCFERMVALQVLDITAISKHLLELELPSSLQRLGNLRTLYLRRWILAGNISIVGRLTSLQILSFAGSVLTKLPKELVELSELKFLDLSACKAHEGFDKEVLSHLVLNLEVFNPPNNPISNLNHDEY